MIGKWSKKMSAPPFLHLYFATNNQAIRYEAHDPDSLKSLYNSLYSGVPQLPPLTDSNEVPVLKPIPVHLEDYDRFLKRGGAQHA